MALHGRAQSSLVNHASDGSDLCVTWVICYNAHQCTNPLFSTVKMFLESAKFFLIDQKTKQKQQQHAFLRYRGVPDVFFQKMKMLLILHLFHKNVLLLITVFLCNTIILLTEQTYIS